MYDVIIIGRGVSGLGAAIYAGRFELKTLVVGEKKAGMIAYTDDVRNYPGFKQITGIGLAQNIEDHAKEYDIEIVSGKVEKISKAGKCFSVVIKGKTYKTKSIIYATGTRLRRLEAKGEPDFFKKGVSYCALCDGPLYKDKIVGVVGGSDSAAKEAILLSKYAKKVYMIYRKEKIRPEPINYERVIKNKKIEIINNTNVIEVKGDKLISSVVLDKPYKGKSELALGGLFVAIGHIALSDLAKELGAKLNEKAEVMIDRHSKTNIAGFFAAGDITDTRFKQAITGVAQGVSAAYSAYEYVSKKKDLCL